MSKLFLLFSLSVCLLNMVAALPVGNSVEILERRMPQRMIIGFRAVRPEIAEEYNKAGTLTNVPASGIQTGEGAYLTAGPGEYKGVPETYWHCVVFAEPATIQSTHKLWIPETDSHHHPLYFKANEQNLHSYVEQHHMHPDEAILFSWIEGHTPPVKQMLIPATYLLGNKGRRSLGIAVKCVSPKEAHTLPQLVADWHLWNIVGFP